MDVDDAEAVGSSTGNGTLIDDSVTVTQQLAQANAVNNDSNNGVTSTGADVLPRVPLTNAPLEDAHDTNNHAAQQAASSSSSSVPVQLPPQLIQPESQGRTRELPRPTTPARRFYDPRLVPIRIRRYLLAA